MTNNLSSQLWSNYAVAKKSPPPPKKKKNTEDSTGIKPMTSTTLVWCSTTELWSLDGAGLYYYIYTFFLIWYFVILLLLLFAFVCCLLLLLFLWGRGGEVGHSLLPFSLVKHMLIITATIFSYKLHKIINDHALPLSPFGNQKWTHSHNS